MTLYRALWIKKWETGNRRKRYLQKGEPWAAWISGYAYDDKGVMKKDSQGNPIPTDEPSLDRPHSRWILCAGGNALSL